MSDFNIKTKLIKGVKITIADTLSRFINLELTEPNPLKKEGYKYGCAVLEQLPDIHDDSSKYDPVLPTDIPGVNATNDHI